MRYFNTYGPVNAAEHYVVTRAPLIADLTEQIEQGAYFTIYAPRQMGKTTLLRQIREYFDKKAGYLPVMLSLEDYESLQAQDFLATFWSELARAFRDELLQTDPDLLAPVQELLSAPTPANFVSLRIFFEQFHQMLPALRPILIIDEFDAIPQSAISSLLQIWRKIYLDSNPPRPLHSVALVGLQNIATLNLGRSSPFNIARQLRLDNFTLDEVRDLLGQYSAESGQVFAPGVVEELHRQSGGHPFLVNRLAALLTEEIATERSLPISADHLETARLRLVRERNYNFETLVRHAKEYQEDVLNILFGAEYEFNLNSPLVHDLHMHGVISRNEQGDCQIANPIYAAVLLAAFRPIQSGLQAGILLNSYELQPHIASHGLEMPTLLSRFREFVERRGREAFKVSPTPQEATGQYLLMAYLEAVVQRTGQGTVFSEVPSGTGRLDLIVVYRQKRYVIETKVWRGPDAFRQGLDQLTDYLTSEGQSVGYYVVFHARPQVYGQLTLDELEFTVQREGVTIYVYLVRLGPLFHEP